MTSLPFLRKRHVLLLVLLGVVIALTQSKPAVLAQQPATDDTVPITVRRGDRDVQTRVLREVPDPEQGRPSRPGSIIVTFKSGVAGSQRRQVERMAGAQLTEQLNLPNTVRIKVPENLTGPVLNLLRRSPFVQSAEPDLIVRPALTPTDTSFGQQWGMTKIGTPAAWNVTTGSQSVRIAVLDCGIFEPESSNFEAPDGQVGHPDLRDGKVVGRANFSSSETTDDLCNHGTHVAGIAAASTNNALGVAGVGFNTKILNVKVLNDNSSGTFAAIINGINWAAGCDTSSTCGPRRAEVINLSLGAQGSCSSALQSAIDRAWNQGLVIVAAAGNNNRSSGFTPANCNRVVAVSASNQNDSKVSFSNFGSWVDVAAPGIDILSTDHAGTYMTLSGTSMASPHVAGLAALVWTTPFNTSNQDLVNRIFATAKKTTLAGSREGRVDAAAAVAPPVLPVYAVRWDGHTTASSVDVNSTTTVDLSFTNIGSLTWPATGANPVRASYHWRTGSCASLGAYAIFEGLRTNLPMDVLTNASVTGLTVQIEAPVSPGTYCLEYDLEHVGVGWFSVAGASTLRVTVNVSAIEVVCANGDFEAAYFANPTLSGQPTINACEAAPINYDWGLGGPTSMPVDNFSARWAGTFDLPAGAYTFTATGDDGVRVWLDGVQIINGWVDQGPTSYSATRTVTAGLHTVQFEYYERGGGALARLSWVVEQTCAAFTAEYFANLTLTGQPAVTACEPAPVDHEWGDAGPASLPVNNFSARWTGSFNFDASPYTFTAVGDDGVRVWLDGEQIVNAWVDQGATTYYAIRNVTAGLHTIRFEYYERGGGALAKLSWAPGGTCPGFTAEYFANLTLAGAPAVTACEGAPVNKDWGLGGPASLPVDNFSVRWTGTFNLEAGAYTFTATGDDGVRVWLDDEQIISAWVDQGPTSYSATRTVTAGPHTVRFEYYERGVGALAMLSWQLQPP